jgi:hypothetical protein
LISSGDALNDAPGIFAVLDEVAPEIPIILDTRERRELVFNTVKECVDSGESWAVIDDDGRVAAFLLVEPDKMERFHRDNRALHLPYAGVTKSQRKQGIFHALLQQVRNRQSASDYRSKGRTSQEWRRDSCRSASKSGGRLASRRRQFQMAAVTLATCVDGGHVGWGIMVARLARAELARGME